MKKNKFTPFQRAQIYKKAIELLENSTEFCICWAIVTASNINKEALSELGNNICLEETVSRIFQEMKIISPEERTVKGFWFPSITQKTKNARIICLEFMIQLTEQ